MGIQERIKEIEKELNHTQLNKATSTHIGMLKSQLSKLRNQLIEGEKGPGGNHEGFDVQRNGDGRVALIGFPSVGKSSLLNKVTDTESEAAAYEFTTLTCIPGNLMLNDTKIQMLDLPGIIEGASSGKGRGREVIAVARSADLVLMVLDGLKETGNQHRQILEREMESMGIRLNQRPPDVYYRKKAGGGVKFNATVALTHLGDDPGDLVGRVLHQYRVHHCEILIREDITVDQLIDVIEGNRKYIKCIYVYNKIDCLSIEEVDELARKDHSVVISLYMNLNIDYMLQKIWDYLGLVRIYTKRRGQPPDLTEPIVLSTERHGTTVESVCKSVSKDLLDKFNYAYVWGRSTKYSPQRCGLAHVIADEDVIQIVPKTLVQEKQSKDYRAKVDAYNAKIAKDRKSKKGKSAVRVSKS